MKTICTTAVLILVAFCAQAQPNWRRELSNVTVLATERPRVITADYGRTIGVAGFSYYKLNVNGEILWQKRLGAQSHLNDVILLEDGSLLLVGRERRIINLIDKDVILVMRVEADGDVIWNRTYASTDWQLGGRCAAQAPDGSIYVGGWRSTQLNGTGAISPLILKFDLDGNLIFGQFTDGNSSIASMVVNEAGEVIGAASKQEGSVGNSTSGYLSFFKFDSNGNPIWWKDSYSGEIAGSAARIVSDEPGHYLVAGTVNFSEVIVVGFDEDGEVTEDVKLSTTTDMRARDFTLEADGGAQMLVSHKFISPADVTYWKPMVIRMNSAFAVSSGINMVQLDFVTLEAQGLTVHDDGTAIIHSSQGNKIHEYKLREDVNVVGCGFSQTTPATSSNTLEVVNSTDLDVFELNLIIQSATQPTIGVLNSNLACGSELCSGDIQISIDNQEYCEGQPFSASTNSGYETYIWHIDDEEVGNASTLNISYDTWGFYSLVAEAYDEYYCYAVDTTDLVIIPSPQPIVSQTDSISLCSGQQLQITLSQAYESYLWSTGSIEPFIFVGEEDWYSITVTAANGCMTESAAFHLDVFPTPAPTINVLGETEFCDNDNTSLGTQSFAQYEWNNGLQAQFIIVDEPGDYYVTVTNSFGCSGQSAGVTLTTLPAPEPMVLFEGELGWCEGESGSANLWVDGDYESVIWNVGGTTDSISVTSSAIVWYDVVDSLGCTGTSNSIFVIEWANPSIVVENVIGSSEDPCDGSIDLNVFAETIDFDVSWAELPGESGLLVEDLCIGAYNVTITDGNGCTSTTTINVSEYVGVAELEEFEILIFPNPVGDLLHIITDSQPQSLTIYDVQGQRIRSWENIASELDVSDMISGNYLAVFTDSDGKQRVVRFGKQ
jgi:hypothetical protein